MLIVYRYYIRIRKHTGLLPWNTPRRYFDGDIKIPNRCARFTPSPL